jgi:hypothetical protein
MPLKKNKVLNVLREKCSMVVGRDMAIDEISEMMGRIKLGGFVGRWSLHMPWVHGWKINGNALCGTDHSSIPCLRDGSVSDSIMWSILQGFLKGLGVGSCLVFI